MAATGRNPAMASGTLINPADQPLCVTRWMEANNRAPAARETKYTLFNSTLAQPRWGSPEKAITTATMPTAIINRVAMT